MTAPIAGWYEDPAGDSTKLRYWDGTKWTDSCMDAAAVTQPPQPGTAYEKAYQQPASAGASPTGAPASAATPGHAQPEGAANGFAQPPAGGAYAGAATPPEGSMGGTPNAMGAVPTYTSNANMPLYYVNQEDSTLRLIAFVLAIISTVAAGLAIIPLAWMIPMTVMTWGVYKGKRPNTVAFGVCSLIFLNIIGGILLLVSTKDR